MKTYSIKDFYPINLAEGEGMGSSYEYYVKRKLLRKFIHFIGRPQKILIAGLPEKYGLSMDFLMLAQYLNAQATVIDERMSVLRSAEETLGKLGKKGLLGRVNVNFHKVDKISDFANSNLGDNKFDLALSCEVFQSFSDSEKLTYIESLKERGQNFVIFAPNGENRFHTTLSGLRSEYLWNLVEYCKNNKGISIYGYGFIDMPPFPPGVSRSQQNRLKAEKSKFESVFMRVLEIYSIIENITPPFIKKKVAHGIFAMGTVSETQNQ